MRTKRLQSGKWYRHFPSSTVEVLARTNARQFGVEPAGCVFLGKFATLLLDLVLNGCCVGVLIKVAHDKVEKDVPAAREVGRQLFNQTVEEVLRRGSRRL